MKNSTLTEHDREFGDLTLPAADMSVRKELWNEVRPLLEWDRQHLCAHLAKHTRVSLQGTKTSKSMMQLNRNSPLELQLLIIHIIDQPLHSFSDLSINCPIKCYIYDDIKAEEGIISTFNKPRTERL